MKFSSVSFSANCNLIFDFDISSDAAHFVEDPAMRETKALLRWDFESAYQKIELFVDTEILIQNAVPVSVRS